MLPDFGSEWAARQDPKVLAALKCMEIPPRILDTRALAAAPGRGVPRSDRELAEMLCTQRRVVHMAQDVARATTRRVPLELINHVPRDQFFQPITQVNVFIRPFVALVAFPISLAVALLVILVWMLAGILRATR